MSALGMLCTISLFFSLVPLARLSLAKPTAGSSIARPDTISIFGVRGLTPIVIDRTIAVATKFRARSTVVLPGTLRLVALRRADAVVLGPLRT